MIFVITEQLPPQPVATCLAISLEKPMAQSILELTTQCDEEIKSIALPVCTSL